MCLLSPSHPSFWLLVPKPAPFRDSLLSPGHFCTSQIARISTVCDAWFDHSGATAGFPAPFVTICLQEPSYLGVGHSFRSAACVCRACPPSVCLRCPGLRQML